MPLYHLILVAVIQGITEFLPVSSSGHLILLPALSGAQDQGRAIDVAAHVGTLTAVIVFCRQEVRLALSGAPSLLRGRVDTQGAWLLLCLAIATFPVVIVGFILALSGYADALRSVTVIGWAMLGFGLLLWWIDRTSPSERTMERWSLTHALHIGIWQAVALIPGTSRSGITITGARFAGYDRLSAAKIAFLMAIPTIIASAVLTGAGAIGANFPAIEAGIVAFLSAIVAFFALGVMTRLLQGNIGFTPYVIYRVLLGILLLYLGYSGSIDI